MIIFGTRGITTTPEKGNFHCPSCTIEQSYRQRRVRRFFHLYFIPIIPLGTVGEYVECLACKDTYNLSVLNYDPNAIIDQIEAEYKYAVLAVMIHILLADGVIDDDEVDTIIDIYDKFANVRLSVREVHEKIAEIRNDSIQLSPYLQALQGRLNENGKETVLKSALLVALSDGDYHQSEKELMQSIGKDLGMSSAHTNGVIAETIADQD